MTWLDEFVAETSRGIPDRVRENLWGRGVSDEQIEAFGIGYLDRALPEIMLPEPFVRWASDKLDDCYVFPITNAIGEIRGLQFRHVERGRPGYMDFLLEQEEAVGFGLAQAMETVWVTEEAVLVEGVFDVLPLQRVIPSVVATLTARVTEPFVRLLRRLVRRVWIGYDNDPTGNRAYQKFLTQHGRDFDIRRLLYPKSLFGGKAAKDPGDLWEAWGDTRLKQFLQSTMGLDNFTENEHAESVQRR